MTSKMQMPQCHVSHKGTVPYQCQHTLTDNNDIEQPIKIQEDLLQTLLVLPGVITIIAAEKGQVVT